jgi:hypothetical protein
MPTRHRLTAMPDGHIDTEKREMVFDLSVSNGRSFSFVAKCGVATQVIGGLGRMFLELQRVVYQAQGIEPSAAEEVHSSHIQKDRWSDNVIVQLTTPAGVPYSFAIPSQIAADIAVRLKTGFPG